MKVERSLKSKQQKEELQKYKYGAVGIGIHTVHYKINTLHCVEKSLP